MSLLAGGKTLRGVSLALSTLCVVFVMFGEARGQTWRELLDAANSQYQRKQYDSCLSTLNQSLARAKSELGDKDTVVANLIHKIGVFYTDRADYEKADSVHQRALDLRISTLGGSSFAVSSSYMELCRIRGRLGDFRGAVEYAESTLAIRKRVLEPDSPDLSAAEFNLGVAYYNLGDYRLAEVYEKHAVESFTSSLGANHKKVALAVAGLANVYLNSGRYALAETTQRRALHIWRNSISSGDSTNLAFSLQNLSITLRVLGKYAEAESNSLEAIAIWRKLHGDKHDELAKWLDDLGSLYADMGRMDLALTTYQGAVAMAAEVLGEDSYTYAYILSDLASVCDDLGMLDSAASLYHRALAIEERTASDDHWTVTQTIANLALNALRREDLRAADSLFSLVLNRLQQFRQDNANLELFCLLGSSETLEKQGRTQQALERLLVALSKAESQGALGHLGSPTVRESLCRHYRRVARASEGLEYGLRAFEDRIESFNENVYFFTEPEAMDCSRDFDQSASECVSAFFDCGPKCRDRTANVASVILKSKGAVTEVIRDRQLLIAETQDSTDRNLVEQLRDVKTAISMLWTSGSQGDSIQVGLIKDSLTAKQIEIESELASRTATNRLTHSTQLIRAEQIASVLDEHAALLEYYRFKYIDPISTLASERYLAIVVIRDADPTVVDIGDAASMDSVIEDYRSHISKMGTNNTYPSNRDLLDYEKIATALYNRLVLPIESYVHKSDLLFIAPDAALNLVSFACLIDGKGKYLIESHPIHYLSAGRDLIRLRNPSPNNVGLFALGDPDFDATVSQRQSLPESSYRAETAIRPSAMMYNQRSVCDKLSEIKVAPLPATREEVTEVVEGWKRATGQQPVYYFGPSASEDRFKSESAGRQVIHLATHGFYLGGDCSQVSKYRRFLDESPFIGENPLLQSGLLLAGANLHGKDADSLGVEDGILTADEVSSLNLEGTKLVVLSACETGLGKVEQGEGVYGLRRAFQMAGVRTVVSALWKVDDRTTAEMMRELYRQSDEPIPVRMRNMQLAQIKKLREEGLPDHPYLLGAFIATGDWR